jgi:hypothetical protein
VLELSERFDDLPILAELGDQLDAAFERRTQSRRATRSAGWPAALRGRRPTGPLVVALMLLVLLAATAAAATLLVLRGSVIPAPRDVPPEQTPAPGSGHVSDLRVSDPQAGIPPWTLRIARSQTGLICSTVGQVVNGQFGLVGLDHRFRVFDEGVSDSCGAQRKDAASLIGARVFDAANRRDVRTVVSGVAGDSLARVRLSLAAGRTIDVPVTAGGVFVSVLRGYPEDLGVTARLAFKDGHTEIHDFGVSPSVVPDPAGGPAWQVQAGSMSGDARVCAFFSQVRTTSPSPRSPSACGILGSGRHQHGWFFALRRITPGTGGPPFDPVHNRGDWGNHPARTAVWGAVGEDVRSIAIRLGNGPIQRRAVRPVRFFLVIFGPHADPRRVTVMIRLRSGRTVVRHGSDRLVTRPVPSGHNPLAVVKPGP